MEKYNKIVRDNIPTEIRNGGDVCDINLTSGNNKLTYLIMKVREEVREFEADRTMDGLVDLVSVMNAIVKQLEIDPLDLEMAVTKKDKQLGVFDEGFVLKGVTRRKRR